MRRLLFQRLVSSQHKILNVAVLAVLGFMSFYLIGHFVPYYDGADSYFYGVNAKNIASGNLEVENSLLRQDWRNEFAGGPGFSRTIYDTAVPAAGIGFSLLGAAVYSAFGEYGLFYLTPIAGIFLLIIVERTSSKLFGRKTGFLSLLFVSSSFFVVFKSKFLQNDVPFTAVFVLGAFFLIQFLHNKKNIYILLASGCFAFTPFLRANGVVFFPAEILILLGYFGIQRLCQKNSFDPKKTLQVTALFLIPWLLFFSFWFSFNDYYFGDPLTNYYTVNTSDSRGTVGSLFFSPYLAENANTFSRFLLPHPLPLVHNFANRDAVDIFGNCIFCDTVYSTANNLLPVYLQMGGMISIIALLGIVALTVKTKKNYVGMLVFLILIASTVWFYSSQRGQEDPLSNQGGKYMIPASVLASVMYAYLVGSILYKNPLKEITFSMKTKKLLFFVFVGGFFVVGLALSAPGRTALGQTESNENLLDVNNPVVFAKRYPLESNLPNESVILSYRVKALEYDSIPFAVPTKGSMSAESLDLLKDTVRNPDYQVFALKEDLRTREIQVYTDLILDHNMVLKNYSEQFCIITFGNNTSDDECLKKLKLN